MNKYVLISSYFLCLSVFNAISASYGGEPGLSQGKMMIHGRIISQNSIIAASDGEIHHNLNERFCNLNQVCAGVNIHFTTGHEKDLDMIASAGFRFIRMDFVWNTIERTREVYNWEEYDELTANLNKRGIRAIYILDYSNPLYEDTVDSKDPITGNNQRGVASPQHPGSIAAFARWAAAAAEHFKESNIVWELWNEPNISFWRPVPDVRQYISLVMAASEAIKTVVPNATIIGPATSQIPFPFIESFMASGVLKYLDGISVHPYRDYSKSPETAESDYQKLYELIEQYAPARKKNIPVISSEWGYSSATKGLSLEKQAAFIVRMQLANLLNRIPVSIWYDWKNDGINPSDFEHNCGTVTFDLDPKPAYIAIRTMNNQLKGFTLSGSIDTGNENDFVLLFENDEHEYKIVAWTVSQPHQVKIEIKAPDGNTILASDGMGEAFKFRTMQSRMILDLTELPQYITIPESIVINQTIRSF